MSDPVSYRRRYSISTPEGGSGVSIMVLKNFVKKCVPPQLGMAKSGSVAGQCRQVRSRSMVEYGGLGRGAGNCKNGVVWRRHSRDGFRRSDSRVSLSELFVNVRSCRSDRSWAALLLVVCVSRPVFQA